MKKNQDVQIFSNGAKRSTSGSEMVRSTLLRGRQFHKIFDSASWQAHLSIDMTLSYEYSRANKSVQTHFLGSNLFLEFVFE